MAINIPYLHTYSAGFKNQKKKNHVKCPCRDANAIPPAREANVLPRG